MAQATWSNNRKLVTNDASFDADAEKWALAAGDEIALSPWPYGETHLEIGSIADTTIEVSVETKIVDNARPINVVKIVRVNGSRDAAYPLPAKATGDLSD